MGRPIETYTDSFGQTIEFSIPEPHKKICINISGGADSAILLMMLVQYCEKHIPDAELHVITSANPIKGWYNAKWSTSVLNKVLHITGTKLIKNEVFAVGGRVLNFVSLSMILIPTLNSWVVLLSLIC